MTMLALTICKFPPFKTIGNSTVWRDWNPLVPDKVLTRILVRTDFLLSQFFADQVSQLLPAKAG
jgi:hypothetical protein